MIMLTQTDIRARKVVGSFVQSHFSALCEQLGSFSKQWFLSGSYSKQFSIATIENWDIKEQSKANM